MINNGDKFEYQEYFIFHNNSIVKFTICKTNQEIMIKSNNYEVKLNHQNIENLINMKFDNIEKEYNYILNLFQQNSIMIKDIIINKSMILSFIQNGKMREIMLLYNNESKSITHYELNFEFKNLMNDIAQIKKDVHDIHNAIHNNNININQNNNNINKNNIFDYNTQEYDIYNDFVIDRTITELDKEIKNQENYLKELEKQSNEYQESAKNLLKKGDKDNCKKLLIKKKKCSAKMKVIEGIMILIEEQKLTLENTKQYQYVLKEIKTANKAILEANKGLTIEELEEMQKAMEEIKKDQVELNEFFNEYKDDENENGNNEEEKKEEIKEEKKEEKKEDKKEQKKEDKKEQKQNIEDNEIKFEQCKDEGYKAVKDGILSIIFANDGISLEGLKRIQDHLDEIKAKQEEFNDFFKQYVDETEEKEE